MAKARRSRATKKGSSTSKASKPARKAARAPRKASKAAKPPKKVELKKLRAQLAGVLTVLSSRRDASPEAMAKLDDSRRRVSQWMTDIDDICAQGDCGPDMVFPLPA